MAGIRLFRIHRDWEDWVSMLLGVVVCISPWPAGQMDSQAVMWNAFLAGAVIILLGALESISLSRWEEAAEIAAGLWVIASPFIFGYAAAGPLRYWHYALGAAVVLLAALELWQDRRLSDRQLAKHGP